MRGRCLLLLTKPAIPGRVKTRLCGHLSAERAADLHAALLGDSLGELRGGPWELVVLWQLDAGETPPRGEPWVGLESWRQEGDDLGERLTNGLLRASERAAHVAAVGSDLPGLAREQVEEAFGLLERGAADVVLGPAEDGGYYLIAARSQVLAPRLFAEIPWSTERVLAETLDRCEELGLRIALLAPGRDVDRPEDLEWLAESLATGRIVRDETAALLAEWSREGGAG